MSEAGRLGVQAKIAMFEQIAVEHAASQGSLQGRKITQGANSLSKIPTTIQPSKENQVSTTSTKPRDFSHLTSDQFRLLQDVVDDIISTDIKAEIESENELEVFEAKKEHYEPSQSLTYVLFENQAQGAENQIRADLHSQSTIDEFVQEKGITEEIIGRDAEMLGISKDEAKVQIVARYKELDKLGLNPDSTKGSLSERVRVTGYPFSLVRSVEGDIGKISSIDKRADAIKDAEEKRHFEIYHQVRVTSDAGDPLIINYMKDKDKPLVIIHERHIAKGTSKEARAASEYFSIRSVSDRGRIADVRLSRMNNPVMRIFIEGDPSHDDIFDTAPIVRNDVKDLEEKPWADPKFAQVVGEGEIKGSEVDDFVREIEIEERFIGKEGFVSSMTVIYTNDGPITLKPIAGFSSTEIKGNDGKVLREGKTVADINGFIEQLAQHATDEECGQVLQMFMSASQAMALMHSAGLVNNDFKPQNCLIQSDGQSCLTDFGTVVERGTQCKDITGTIFYMSPEALKIQTPKDPSMDVWSFGISLQQLYAALSGNSNGSDIPTMRAFGVVEKDQEGILEEVPKIGEDEYQGNYPEPNKETSPFLYLCWSCTRFDPEKRPSMEDVAKFIAENHDSIVQELIECKNEGLNK